MSHLEEAGIKVLSGAEGPVEDALERFSLGQSGIGRNPL